MDSFGVVGTNKLNTTEKFRWEIRDFIFILYFLAPIMNNIYAKFLSSHNTMVASDLTFVFLFVVAILLQIPTGKIKQIAPFFAIFICSLVVLGLSFISNTDIQKWMLHSNWGVYKRILSFDSGIYILLVFLLIREPKRIFRNFEPVVIIGILYSLLQLRNAIAQGGWEILHASGLTTRVMQYNMGFGYRMTLYCLISIAIFVLFKKRTFLVVGILAMFLSVMYGSRGVLLNYLLFALLFSSVILKGNRKWTFIIVVMGVSCLGLLFIMHRVQIDILIFGLLLGVLFLLFLVSFLITPRSRNLYQGIVGIGFLLLITIIIATFQPHLSSGYLPSTGSRNLDNILNSTITDDNGRSQIWEKAWEIIKDRFPLGNGAYGDRPIIGLNFAWGYSHNIILEMIVSFGLVGVVIIAYLFYLVIKTLLQRNSAEFQMIFIVYLSMASKLLVSDSFWYSPEFWGVIALLVINFDHKRDIRKEQEVCL